jgi:23S rRNA (guanosine2251-2'-O)-methyltransferase
MTDKRWVYGNNPVYEALRANRAIFIYISKKRQKDLEKIILTAESKKVPVEFKDDSFFDRFCKGHQGIAAVVKEKTFLSIEELLKVPGLLGEVPFFLILDGLEDPRNFGAILRVVDASGIHGVVLQSHRSVRITETVSKASAGAVEFVNISHVVNIKHAIDKMKRLGIAIFGAEVGSDLTPWNVDMKVPLAIVIGSEGKGIRLTVKRMCDFLISLPMKGMVNSLNVSVATGIIAYEVLRQRSH